MKPSAYQDRIYGGIVSLRRHIVISACAGSGKTTTLVECVKRLKRERIALMAFGRPIAETLKGRVTRGRVSTFHSAGHSAIMMNYGRGLDLDKKKVDTLCKEMFGIRNYGLRCMVREVVKACKISLAVIEKLDGDQRRDQIKKVAELLDEWNVALQPNLFPQRTADWTPRELFVELCLQVIDATRDPRTTGTFDHEDQLWLPSAEQLKVRKYEELLIDELQDMSNAQLALVLKMRADDGRIIACGDDHQAIFSFAGARQNAVGWLQGLLNAEVFELPVCYRCARSIIELAQEFVPSIQARDDADAGEVRLVDIRHMLDHTEPGDFVLGRSRASIASACLRLLRMGKPVSILGREIGEELIRFIQGSECQSVEEFKSYLDTWRKQEIARLESEDRSTQSVIDMAECLFTFVEGIDRLPVVVDRIRTLFVDADNIGERIVCATVHRAKGREAGRVWLLGESFQALHYRLSKELRRSNRPERVRERIQEENNLLYVAVTRAMHALYCVDAIPSKLVFE